MQGLSTSRIKLRFDLAWECGPRERNEDSATFSPYGNFFAIADGIGGAPLGDVASKISCNQAVRGFIEKGSILGAFERANSSLIEFKQALRTHDLSSCSIGSLLPPPFLNRVYANRYFGDASSTAADRRSGIGGIGSTLLLAHCDDEAIHFVWAGDTAAFRLRGNAMECVACPDNVNGTNQLGSAVGYEVDIVPLQASCSMQPGDRFLLCTDGVWGTLGLDRMGELLAQSDDEEKIAKSLAREAAENGHDNATAFVFIVEKNEEEPDGIEQADEHEIPDIPCTPTYPAIMY